MVIGYGSRPAAGGLSGRALGVAAGLLADRALGEPPAPLHPVARFGQLMESADRRWWRDRRSAGALYAGTGVAAAAAMGAAVTRGLGPVAATAAATALAAAGRSLLSSARAVEQALDRGDLAEARRLLPTLVGRDPDGLDGKEIARAVVESVGENLSDAVVATACWGLVGGAPGAAAHRASNTLDAMVGYRSPRYRNFGWGAARLDDVMAWLPARLTAALVLMVEPRRTSEILGVVRQGARRHPSPNAGVAEAAFAGALGLRLGGENRYGSVPEVRPPLGHGPAPEPGDIGRAVRLAERVIALLTALLVAGGLAGLVASRRPRRPRGVRR